MAYDRQFPGKSLTVMQLWRKAGVDFDCGSKSSLAQLLELGGYFPLSKVQDRLPISRHCLYQLSRGHGDDELTNCVMPIRVNGEGRAITILVDVARLNDLLSAQLKGRFPARPGNPQPGSEDPLPHQETR